MTISAFLLRTLHLIKIAMIPFYKNITEEGVCTSAHVWTCEITKIPKERARKLVPFLRHICNATYIGRWRNRQSKDNRIIYFWRNSLHMMIQFFKITWVLHTWRIWSWFTRCCCKMLQLFLRNHIIINCYNLQELSEFWLLPVESLLEASVWDSEGTIYKVLIKKISDDIFSKKTYSKLLH